MKRLTLFPLILLGALLLSACATATTSSWPGLAADADRAYLASGSYVIGIRLSDGTKLWQYPEKAGPQHFYSSPTVAADGQVLVGSAGSDYGLVSLDGTTGAAKWPVPFAGRDRWVAPPVVTGTTVYAANNDGTLYAISLADGSKQWSIHLGGEIWGAPATNGKLVFVNSLDHNLYAVDSSTIKLVWKVDLGGAAPSAPAVSADGSTVYTGSFGKKVFAVDAATGAVRWTATTRDWIWGTPALTGSNLLAADISGNIYSFGAADGKDAGPVLQPDGPITGGPLVTSAGGVVVATESGNVVAYDGTGTRSWDVTLGGKIYTPPVAGGDLFAVAPLGADSLLAGVSQDGKIMWKFTGK